MEQNGDSKVQKILDSLTIEVNDYPSGYRIRLNSYVEILSFFEEEKRFWTAFHQELMGRRTERIPMLSTLVSYFNGCVLALQAYKLELTDANHEQRWSQAAPYFTNPSPHIQKQRVIYSKTAIASFIVDIYREDVAQGNGAYSFISVLGFPRQQATQSEIVGYLRAFQYDKKPDQESQKRYDIEQRTLQELCNTWEQTTGNLRVEFENFKQSSGQWRDAFQSDQTTWTQDTKDAITTVVKERTDALDKLMESYNEKLKVEAPVKYWNARAKTYRNRGWIWVGLLSASVLFIVATLLNLLYFPPPPFLKSLFAGEPLAIKGIIVLATIISFMAYLSRMCARMALSSFHIERDAEEREQLTYVYLALIKDGAMSVAERNIVLQSLFSRVDTGLLGDDSSPTMPIFNTLLDQAVPKNAKK